MSIKTVSIDEVRRMNGSQGIVLQGCGGDLQEWLDGFNDLMTEQGILLNGSRFQNCSAFKNGDITCILYPFEGAELNLGKLAIWRALGLTNMSTSSSVGLWMKRRMKIWTKEWVCANELR